MPRAQWEALEADLVPMGWTLADVPQRLGWRALMAWVKRAPRESNSYALSFGPPARWGDLEYMTALAVDYLAWLLWMNSEDGHKGRNKPTPLPRPGVEPVERKEATRLGNAHMSLNQAREWLGW